MGVDLPGLFQRVELPSQAQVAVHGFGGGVGRREEEHLRTFPVVVHQAAQTLLGLRQMGCVVVQVHHVAVEADAADLDALLAVVKDGKTVAEIVTEKSGQTGEKVELAYYGKIEAPMCVTYIHMNSKLGTLIGFNKEIDKEVAKDVAMQAAAMAPVSIDKGDCDPKIIEHERMIGREQARQEGKPEAMLDKIAEGKVNKFLKENTLLNQDLVKNNKISVGTYIKEADKDATVIAYKRFSLND